MKQESPVEYALVKRCIDLASNIAVAESCSGGLIAHRITNVPGASTIFKGSVVVYANEVKMHVLGVPEDVLAAYGAVSEAVALAMAQGVRHRMQADFSTAVTGIAGPGGGTDEKPVGTVYIATASPSEAHACLYHFSGDRSEIKVQTSETAMISLLKLLERS
ncbi:MAG: CinA family protein [Candidatus Hydrogenedentes bacterium]|nr:CinA family protein [Candidatus Hydrogenedentota bacterium]